MITRALNRHAMRKKSRLAERATRLDPRWTGIVSYTNVMDRPGRSGLTWCRYTARSWTGTRGQSAWPNHLVGLPFHGTIEAPGKTKGATRSGVPQSFHVPGGGASPSSESSNSVTRPAPPSPSHRQSRRMVVSGTLASDRRSRGRDLPVACRSDPACIATGLGSCRTSIIGLSLVSP